MKARAYKPPHGGRPPSVYNPWRPLPPPLDPVYPELHPRYGGLAGDDERPYLDEAERLLGQWPAEHQHDLTAALEYVRARERRTRP